MRKIATIAAGAALAAGVVLVPVATASAATSAAASSPVTNVHPRVSLYDCIVSGGQVLELSPGYGYCVGGYLDGQPVWW
ncbi:hypothetical protein KGQ20_18395 [Catenulispora sp. NF23]|uniref:Secreted protein n=1 Tax=Catenulispora pinistramenti TaxID=2705254 RepID=A0ABS5KZ41_9ACTN|nr:hypothetical protein [Catenulispora pinistramenti]MBS2534743.1 hypothetical protein [Catenulispora pinistramenti]MBS2551252.1 hypothetical protein [Catenulispora pinistramenti]